MKRFVLAVLMLATPAVAQDAPFVWKYQPAPGSKWKLRSFVRMRSTQTATEPKPRPGMKKPLTHRIMINMTQKITADYDVLSREADGAYFIQVAYQSYSTDMDVTLDGKPAPAEIRTEIAVALNQAGQAFANARLRLRVSPRGEVEDVQGLEDLQNKASAGDPGTQALVQPFLAQIFSKESLKSSTGLGSTLPTQPLAIGQSYPYSLTLSQSTGSATVINGARTLTRRVNGKANFNEQGTFAIQPSKAQADARTQTTLAVKMAGSLQGRTVVDEASGLPASSGVLIRYTGTTQMSRPGQPKPVVMPLWASLEQNMVLEPRS